MTLDKAKTLLEAREADNAWLVQDNSFKVKNNGIQVKSKVNYDKSSVKGQKTNFKMPIYTSHRCLINANVTKRVLCKKSSLKQV